MFLINLKVDREETQKHKDILWVCNEIVPKTL
jgi:hypothetical protein